MAEKDYQEAELEFPKSSDPLMDEEISGKIGGEVEGEIFIPMESEADEGTLDEPVSTTLVSASQVDLISGTYAMYRVRYPLQALKV